MIEMGGLCEERFGEDETEGRMRVRDKGVEMVVKLAQ